MQHGLAAGLGLAIVVLVGGLTAVVATQRDVPAVERSAPTRGAEGSLRARADATISYDGSGIRSTLPTRWQAGRMLTLAIENPNKEVLHLVIGTYERGSGRADLQAYAVRKPLALIDASPPFLRYPPAAHVHVYDGNNLGAGEREPIYRFRFAPGRYYVVAFDGPEDATSTDPADPRYFIKVLRDLRVVK